MKTLSIVSQKGGVGKTTLSLNLAYSLARADFRVALLDVDPQGGIGHSLRDIASSGGVFACTNGGDPAENLLQTRIPQFSIMPVGDVAPENTEQFGASLADGEQLRRIGARLAAQIDILVIDTPSGFGGATMGALRAADFAVSPLQAEPIALRTLPQLLRVIGSLRSEGLDVSLAGLVLCMLQQRNADSLAVAEEVWSKLPQELVLETTIPRDEVVLDASAKGVPLGLISRLRQPPLALVFQQLAAELAPRLGLTPDDGEEEPLGLFA